MFLYRHSRPNAKHEGKGILNKPLLIQRFPFFFGASTSSVTEKTGMTKSNDN
jgi:hypothetical protein